MWLETKASLGDWTGPVCVDVGVPSGVGRVAESLQTLASAETKVGRPKAPGVNVPGEGTMAATKMRRSASCLYAQTPRAGFSFLSAFQWVLSSVPVPCLCLPARATRAPSQAVTLPQAPPGHV